MHGGDAVFGEVRKDEFDASAALGGGGVGNILLNEADRGTFEQHAREFAAGVVLKFAAFGIGSVFGHPCQLQCERIGDRDVARDMNQEHGIFRADGVELLARGEFFVGP